MLEGKNVIVELGESLPWCLVGIHLAEISAIKNALYGKNTIIYTSFKDQCSLTNSH
jgi:hypothetical protein